MSVPALIVMFVFGLAAGSFLNVVALRYQVNGKLFAASVVSGRSHCPNCKTTLRWFELIPLLSFVFLRGRCRTCHARLSFQYPFVELLAGLIAVFAPLRLEETYQVWRFSESLFAPLWFYCLLGLWLFALYAILLIALIDLRTYIIPDQLNVFLGILAIGIVAIQQLYDVFGIVSGTFLRYHALIFGFRDNIFINHGLGALVGLVFFGAIVLFTRGRGMGMGDVKLVAALGLLFGWPDVIFIIFFSFIIGSIVALVMMALRKKGMKDLLPFGPFLSLGAFILFFCGFEIMGGYLKLFPVA